MIFGAIYYLDTGKVKMTCNGPDEDFLHLQIGESTELGVYVGQIDMKTHYLPGGVPTERPVMPIVASVGGVHKELTEQIVMTTTDDLLVVGIPQGTKLFHPAGIEDPINDGYVEWGSTTTGEFTLSFSCHPFKEVILNAKVG